jgi:hypothetical protein
VRPPADGSTLLRPSVSELLRDVEQVVDLFFEACGRLPPVVEADAAPGPNIDKSVFADGERVDSLFQDRASGDFEPASGEDEGTIRPTAWRWLSALLIGGAGAAAVAFAMNQRRRVGAWPPGRGNEIEL